LIDFLDATNHHLSDGADELGPAEALPDELSLALGDCIALALGDLIGHRRCPAGSFPAGSDKQSMSRMRPDNAAFSTASRND
jgi:hypothetical protein